MMHNIELIEEINDNNLYLRKISKDDISFFYESLKIKDITNYLSLGPLLSYDHAKRIIKNYLKYWEGYLQFNYIIELREGPKPLKIGSVSLWNISWQHKRAEIGVWLVPNYWEKGIGKKTLKLIKKIAFIHLKLNRIQAHVALENLRSISTFKNSGFLEEGQLKEYLNLNGKFYDAIILACLKKS
ncbi:MAG: GNAT family N-acetyltransferase [Promethearchaeota archaeon]